MVSNYIPGYNNQQQINSLGHSNETALMALAAQGNPQLNRAVLMEQAAAQRSMQEMASQRNLEVPKVNFYPSTHGNSRKARKQDIRQAYRLLRPAKRSLLSPARLFGSKYRYNKQSHVCVVDGCDCKELIQYDNLYEKICDDETGRSLWDMYWQNPVTGQAEAFLAMDKVTSGRKMRGTYCPEHLHLYHLLCKWENEEEREYEMNPNRLRDKVKQGVSIVTVPVSVMQKNDADTPLMLSKYEPFFELLEKDARAYDGINITHYKNPETGINDITTVTFDLRIFQKELLEINQPTPAFQQIINQQPNNTPPIPNTQGVNQ
tara:strand:+ start:2385 stop:3341 length:957 start_codon:yes stop_codon:yes gene_type:complete